VSEEGEIHSEQITNISLKPVRGNTQQICARMYALCAYICK
jgi:hypothetical protein